MCSIKAPAVAVPRPVTTIRIVDWYQFGSGSGTFAPGLGSPAISPPAYQGQNVAFLNSDVGGGGYITQDLGDLTGGITYQISIEVASRGLPFAGDTSTPQAIYRIGAATGGSAASPTWTTFYQISGDAPANETGTDNWELVNFQFTPISSGDWYTFISDDGAVGGGLAQLEVDAAAVPEASTPLLLAVMIVCLAVFQSTFALRRRVE